MSRDHQRAPKGPKPDKASTPGSLGSFAQLASARTGELDRYRRSMPSANLAAPKARPAPPAPPPDAPEISPEEAMRRAFDDVAPVGARKYLGEGFALDNARVAGDPLPATARAGREREALGDAFDFARAVGPTEPVKRRR